MNREGKMRIYKTLEVLQKLEESIDTKTPFSLVRFGDGGIKLIHSYFYNDTDQIEQIVEKEGIPKGKFKNLIDLWAISASTADFVDTPYVYFSGEFWPRVKGHKSMSKRTIERLKMWRRIYRLANFDVKNYCNPEVNFLSCLNIFGNKGFPDLFKDKKICIITSRLDLKRTLKPYTTNIDIVNIPGFTHNQYDVFQRVLNKIKLDSKKYDLWLVAAGELGRIYTGIIKFHGGISFDIGSTVDFWATGEIPVRLSPYVEIDYRNKLKIKLTQEGEKYREFL